jgi:signal peptidase I
MNWNEHRENLKQGKKVQFRPKGNSMQPIIESGNLVTVEPIEDHKKIKKGDVVFCKVKGNYYVHLVTAVQQKMGGMRFQISNNKNHTNGWVGEDQVFGKVTTVEE